MQQEEQNLRFMGGVDQVFRKTSFPKPFRFNEEVASVFDDMVQRSIPQYALVTEIAVEWASRYYQPDTMVYDIGCSTGTFLDLLSRRLDSPARMVGIDLSEPMVQKARQKMTNMPNRHSVDFRCQDACDILFQKASVIVVNYTFQFLEITKRRQLFRQIYDALVPGGILFFSEKVRCNHSEFQETITDLYEHFKESHGYTKSEIARKKEALENVLVPFTEEEYRVHLKDVGFQSMDSVSKWLNFMSFVAQKGYGVH